MKRENIEDIGAKIKEIRKKKQMTLQILSEYTGLSLGFLSNLERNLTSPSLENLKVICDVLDISITELISTEKKEKLIIRKKDIKILEYPQYNQTVSYIDFGVTEQVHEIMTILPGTPASDNISRHLYDEAGTVMEGELTVSLEGTEYILHEGDSIYIKRDVAHSLYNHSDKTCISYWICKRGRQ